MRRAAGIGCWKGCILREGEYMSQGTLLFYINAIHEGGAERVILQLAKHFAEAGYRAVLVTSFVDQNEYPIPEGVERLTLEDEPNRQNVVRRNVSRIRALRSLCKKLRPEAVISFMAEPNMRAVLATVGCRTKTIVSVRNDPNREYAGRLGRFVGKHLLPHADGCVFQTEEARQWFPQSLQKKSRVIFNDVDNVFFETEYVGGRDIITLGRLTPQKNHRLLIEAFSRVADKHPDTNLLIYGIGPLEAELKREIAAHGMESRILLKGLTTDSPAVLSHARGFVLSSDYEGMPNALLEALAIGVPSVSTDCPCGGPRMLIEDGVNGRLIPVNDCDALTQALDELLSSPDRAAEMGRIARERSVRYRTDRVFAEWRSYVEGCIAPTGR